MKKIIKEKKQLRQKKTEKKTTLQFLNIDKLRINSEEQKLFDKNTKVLYNNQSKINSHFNSSKAR